MIRVGFIGAGGNTRLRHLPGFRAEDHAELAAVCNRSRESSESVAAEFGVPRIFENWRELVTDPEIDAVCIGTWPNLHAEVTCAALAAGKHVLCEARMARDLAEARAMAEAADRHPDLVAQIVPSPFTLAVDEWIHAQAAEGRLGEILEIRARFLNGSLRDPRTPFNWRLDPELSGKNTMVLGILHEAILRWVNLPDLKVETASAGWGARERPDGDKLRRTVIPESLQVTACSANGVRLLYDLSHLHSGEPENWIQLNGSRGRIRVDIGGSTVLSEFADETGQFALEDGWDVEGEFIRSILSGNPVRRTSFADGLVYMEFTEAVWSAWS